MRWLALDSTVPAANPGWEPPQPTRRHYWGDDSLGVANERKTMGYVSNPQMGSFFGKLKKMAFKGIKVGEAAAAGFATGGPAGAATGAAKATLSGYHDPRRYQHRHRRHHEDARDQFQQRHRHRHHQQRYLGDAMGDGAGGSFLSSMSPMEKELALAAGLGLLVAIAK